MLIQLVWLAFICFACTNSNGTDAVEMEDDDIETEESQKATYDPSLWLTNAVCRVEKRPVETSDLELSPFLEEFDFALPLGVFSEPQNPGVYWVITQPGLLHRIVKQDGKPSENVILDIGNLISYTPRSETGLLGFAFHPDFPRSKEVFLSYTAKGSSGLESRITRMSIPTSGELPDPTTEETILSVSQPFVHHNGGSIAFGEDRMLYIGLGDGGKSGDPFGNGQNTQTLLGAMLRIDVFSDTQPYGIPADNPFVGNEDGKDEIWAWGLRNPWRWSFDRETGDLWAADVGQNAYEEINIIQKGGNYGWATMEADSCYESTECKSSGLKSPIASYSHSEGKSITGGYVYRGEKIATLMGQYIFGDFITGKIWKLKYDEEKFIYVPDLLLETGRNIVSFGETDEGEIIVIDYATGKLFVLVETSRQDEHEEFPTQLAQTGCFTEEDGHIKPKQIMIPYQPVASFWSNGAFKSRWLALPKSTQISHDKEAENFNFPVGSIFFKEFKNGEKQLEVRMLVHHETGEWGGYTYVSEGNEFAELVTADRVIDNGKWRVPSRSQCFQCHTEAAGRVLGFRPNQLQGQFPEKMFGGVNQMKFLADEGVIEKVEFDGTPLVDPYNESEDIEKRARSWLATNCASCHMPEGTGRGKVDLRYQSILETTCNTDPEIDDLGIEGAKLIVPGAPEKSLVYKRILADPLLRMPPLGVSTPDFQGAQIVHSWIEELGSCDED